MNQPSYEILKISKTYNPSWFTLETSTESLPIYYDDLLDLKIAKGTALNPHTMHDIYLRSLRRKAQGKILRKLTSSSKSTAEVIKLIKETIYKMNKENKKEVQQTEITQIIEQILESLGKYNYINDDKYALQLVNKYLSARKPKGTSYIKTALLSKGLTESQVEKAFSEAIKNNPLDEVENAKQLLTSFINKKKYQNADAKKQNQMALRFLAAQGYPIGVGVQALKTLKDSE